MFLLTVASIIVSLQNVEGGYDYARPGARLSLPNHKLWPGVQGFEEGRLNKYKKPDERKISHSLPYRNYDFLQQHKNGKDINYFPKSFNTSPYQKENFNIYREFNSNTNIGTSNTIQSSGPEKINVNRPTRVYGSPEIVQSQTLTHHHQAPIAAYLHNGPQTDLSGIQEYNVQQTLHRFEPNLKNAYPNVASHLNLQNSLPTDVNFGSQLGVHFRKEPIFFNPQSIPNVLETHDQNMQTVAPLLDLQNDFSSQKTNTPQINANINPSLDNLNNLPLPNEAQNTISPVITKHIYFHAPPPDVEETSVKPTPSKKTYKIIFIKVPSQESKKIEELQEAYNRLGPIEDKTLIYLLSNHSEDYSHLVPAYKPSEHEVLFVKYNDNQSIGSEGNLIGQDHGIYHKR